MNKLSPIEPETGERKLTEQESDFVQAYASTGSSAAAAMLAGLAGASEKKKAQIAGDNMLNRRHVGVAVKMLVQKKLEGAAFIALNVTVGVLESKTANDKDKLRAAEIILDRGAQTAKISRQERALDVNVNGPADLIALLWERRKMREMKESVVIDADVIAHAEQVIATTVVEDDEDFFENALEGRQ